MFLSQRVSLILFFQLEYYVLRSEISRKIFGNRPGNKIRFRSEVYELVVNRKADFFPLNQIVSQQKVHFFITVIR